MAEPIVILVDGVPYEAEPGQTVAAVLLSQRRWQFGCSPAGRPRGPLCGMGTCFECAVAIDGIPNVRACLEPVRNGMQVVTGA
ncbi:MAG TPA: (2Fe-2S)-binding protein [Gemmatimonadales bacterium]|nr:(2Fe-2S)-binding protein [Gemmatimonadales bacterium]